VGTRSLRQTSLVVDPPNGRVPARTPRPTSGWRRWPGGQPAAALTWEDRSLFERCISRGPLASLPTLYGNGLRIVQSPTTVAISHEMIHEARIIPLDGRAPAGGTLKSYMGYSTGRWESDTLVVETSGFTDKTALAGTRHSERLKVVERFTRVSADTVNYEATVTDPETWTRPWSVLVL